MFSPSLPLLEVLLDFLQFRELVLPFFEFHGLDDELFLVS